MPGIAVGDGMHSSAISLAVPTQVREFNRRQSRNLLIEILVMLVSTMICILLYLGGGAGAVNYLAPATILVVGISANVHMVRHDPNTLLTPLFSTRLIALVVFGIGALSHNWISGLTQSSFDYMIVISADDAARVNLLWLGGMDAILIGVLVSLQLFGWLQVRATSFVTPFSFNTALALLWAGSAPILLTTTSFTWPNILNNLFSALQLSGMFLMGRTSGTKIINYIWILASIFLLILASLYFMNKTILLYRVLALVLGFISVKASFPRVRTR